ncbi:alpha/beta hydrolase [Mucilaginibacter agri]|uniref:Alpha/beta hydrolase n=1 Tax=Mucilaginibacter agri TaxID=2695265 RepID=A0A966DSQ8_9SPHI|nr:alpha/beta hydrolase-fold protein [Mucilaginibacter agri]NCD69865.1 alpha/beta hydrolase [Mucilaginibacter agri]
MIKKTFFCAFLLFGQIFLSNAQPKITFKVHVNTAPKQAAEELYLAGNFNDWKPSENVWKLEKNEGGNYSLITSIKPGIYSYKITHGSWEKVECAAGGKQMENRSLNIHGDTTINLTVEDWQDNFAAPVKQHTATSQVHLITEHFEMPQLGRQRRIWVYLPKDYATSKRRYPVIYMHDGQNLFDEFTASYGEWGIDELMEKVPGKDQCIIIGVDHGGEYRMSEYNPYDFRDDKGRGSDYVDFLAKTLKPCIDKHYRTLTDAKHTAIAGSSMGGLISMYAETKYPEVFGQAGIFSPAFWTASPQIYDFVQKQKFTNKERFYFVCGDAESDSMVSDMEKMAEMVRAKGVSGINTPVVVIKGAQHNEKQWNGDFPAFYNWLLAGFR